MQTPAVQQPELKATLEQATKLISDIDQQVGAKQAELERINIDIRGAKVRQTEAVRQAQAAEATVTKLKAGITQRTTAAKNVLVLYKGKQDEADKKLAHAQNMLVEAVKKTQEAAENLVLLNSQADAITSAISKDRNVLRELKEQKAKVIDSLEADKLTIAGDIDNLGIERNRLIEQVATEKTNLKEVKDATAKAKTEHKATITKQEKQVKQLQATIDDLGQKATKMDAKLKQDQEFIANERKELEAEKRVIAREKAELATAKRRDKSTRGLLTPLE